MSDQVIQLFAVLRILRNSVGPRHYRQLLTFDKGVLKVAESVEHTPEHPDVNLLINLVSQVEVAHLWWPVHQSGIFFESLLVKVELVFGDHALGIGNKRENL